MGAMGLCTRNTRYGKSLPNEREVLSIGRRLCSHNMERYERILYPGPTVLNFKPDPDMSIWEVRNNKQNFVYSKIMLWVAFDRGLRLAEKRCLPCPNRAAWLAARDEIYEDIMTKGIGYNGSEFAPLLTNQRL